MKTTLVLALPMFLALGLYVMSLSIWPIVDLSVESILFFLIGLFITYISVMGASLLPFIFHTLVILPYGVQINRNGSPLVKLRWSEIGKVKQYEFLQILKLYDKTGKLVYAVDFMAENFPQLYLRLQQKFPRHTATESLRQASNAMEGFAPNSFPYEIQRITTAQELATTKLSAAPNQAVLIGDIHSIYSLDVATASSTPTPEEILALASTIDLSDWVTADARSAALEDQGISLGEWPTTPAQPTPDTHPSLSEKLIQHGAYAAILPCHDIWAVPAYLLLGDLDDCPPPEIHVALAKKWFEQFDARIVAITPYTIEFKIGNPPSSQEACERLAWEHILYAPECLGEQSIREYAHTLAADKKWFFLWD